MARRKQEVKVTLISTATASLHVFLKLFMISHVIALFCALITESTGRTEASNEVTSNISAVIDGICIEEIVTLMNDEPAIINLPLTPVTDSTHSDQVRLSFQFLYRRDHFML